MSKSWLRELRSVYLIVGASIVIFYIIFALIAPIIAPPVNKDPYRIWNDDLGSSRVKPPGSQILSKDNGLKAIELGYKAHYFGSIEGWDIYYGCVLGAVVAFRVGLLVVLGALAIGLNIGAIAGYFGGVVDQLLMGFTDFFLMFFFSLVLAMVLVIAIPDRLTLLNQNILLTDLDKVALALIIVGWPWCARIVRDDVFRIKHEEHEASEGTKYSSVPTRAIYPISIMHALCMSMGSIVLLATALSFLGIGAPIGYADWGQLISLSRNYIYVGGHDPWKYWYTFAIPSIFLFTFVLGWILLGEGFRGILDHIKRK
jgi:peptide/nickel transport system permease protein